MGKDGFELNPMERKSKNLGSWTLTALVVANVIGAGVFATSGLALSDLGSPLRVIAAWFIGGLLALCGALSYGALARLIPESGGEYLYLSRALHPATGFIAGWISLLPGFTGAIAFAALTFAAYAIPGGATPLATNLVATGAIAVAVILHALGVRQGAAVQNVAVLAEADSDPGILFLCGVRIRHFVLSGLAEVSTGAYEIPPFSIATFALSLMWISFSYSGFNAAVYLAGEVPSARERIPRALLLGTGLTMLIYLALNTVFVLAPSMDAVAGQEDVAAVAAETIGGAAMASAVRAVVALALFTSVSAMVMVGPRVYAKMADDGLFPSFLRFEGETPAASILLQGTLAVVVVWIAELRELLSILDSHWD